MSLRVCTKPVFVFFSLAATRGTHMTKVAAAVTLAVARSATTPKTWPRSTPKIIETGDAPRGASPRTIQTAFFFWSDVTFLWPDGCSAGRSLFFSFPEQASLTLVDVQFFYIFLANRSTVGQPHPTKGAEIYCCLQAGGILAATQVCCAGCTPLCAGRCARRLFVLLVVPFLLLS